MANVNLLVGGTPIQRIPACNALTEFGSPYASMIGDEYARGYYTLGAHFMPTYIPQQEAALIQKPAVVGDILYLYQVPELHSVSQMFCLVNPSPMATSGQCGGLCGCDNMDGVTFDVVAQKFDMNGTIDPVTHLPPELGPAETIAGFTGLNGDTLAAVRTRVDWFTDLDTMMLIGIKILTPSNTPNTPISQLSGQIMVVSKVDDFEVGIVR